MDGKSKRWVLLVAGIVALLSVAATRGSSSAEEYVYSDDFSTGKAMVDSYWHSEFLEELPDTWPLAGFLLYESPWGDTRLTLYGGSQPDSYAWLKYEFPIAGGVRAAGFTSAVVELELEMAGLVQCDCTFFEGHVWELPYACTVGTHRFEFFGSEPIERVYIGFRGWDAGIDNLVITLSDTTPVESSSWTRIKNLFRSPPN